MFIRNEGVMFLSEVCSSENLSGLPRVTVYDRICMNIMLMIKVERQVGKGDSKSWKTDQ